MICAEADVRTHIRRGLLAFALLAAVWSGVIALTGGFAIHAVGIRVASRNVWNPIQLALVSALAAIAMSAPNYRSLLSDDLSWLGSMARRARTIAARSRWINFPTLIAITGAALQIHQWAGARPLWLDEEMIALNFRDRALPDLAGSLWFDQSAPFGWLAAQRGVLLLFGPSESAIRFVPMVFGVATLCAARWVGRRWMASVGATALVILCSLGQWVSHYSLELKHYSADVFFGLLLPALVVWAIEADEERSRLRRAAIWWVVAAVSQWFANGAAFVTPACALVLFISLWRLDGRRSAIACVLVGFSWLASFGLHYLLALRFTLSSDYLRGYWSAFMPPSDVVGSVRWLSEQAAPFAVNPGGTALPVLFWAAAVCGCLFARRRLLGYMAAAIPVSAFVLSAVRVVPLYERLSLWAVPALYLGIALCLDTGIQRARDAYRGRRPEHALFAAMLAVAGLWVCVDIGEHGWNDIVGRHRNSNHQLDDRTSVEWLLARRRPGDALLSTRLALPAIWWYGGESISPPASGSVLHDGIPILEVSHRPPGPECDEDALERALIPHERALVYFGFRFDDVPDAFDDILLQRLERIGRVIELRRFSNVSRAGVVELAPGRRTSTNASGLPYTSGDPRGCLDVQPAMRW
jgi:hypothetical protein